MSDMRAKHDEVIAKGLTIFPEINSLAKKHDVINSIQNFNYKTLEKTWHSELILHGRYLVVMAIPVDLDVEKVTLKRNGNAFLMINEITSIDDPANPNSQLSISYSGGVQRRLEGEDLNKLIKSGWDFQVIGIAEKAPIKNIEIFWDRKKKLNR